ncbi:MAG: hypothetical protein HY912_21740 [Desulfomonile tiedjei]|uniref:Uncharacterized protein n=1 Tax=Desulfomonile tiedjei TaxID=2358 RepID=A0A9D6V4V4_9BACT|nr:hypothetical protein [Desulfomonile tiedjei]
MYDYPGKTGLWAISGTGAARFGYNYAIGTWYGYDSFGAAWQTLSNGGRSSNFVGGGTLTDIGGGWSFLYDYTNATGLWAISGSGAARFGYNYGSGKWSEYDPYFSTWQTLSNAGRSSRFVGNGALNDLGNGWSYRFIYSGDFGYWARSGSGAIRFGYNYGSGRWSEYDPYLSIWQTLSNAGRSSKFVGNGALNDLGNGWSFVYNYTGDTGVWAKNGSVTSRFEYNYSNGQWRNQGDFGGWALLGSIQVSSAFIGNGAWHDIKNGWAYQYASANDNGWWRNDVSGVTEYNYQYTVGQWWQYIGAWNPYGPPNSSAQFPG